MMLPLIQANDLGRRCRKSRVRQTRKVAVVMATVPGHQGNWTVKRFNNGGWGEAYGHWQESSHFGVGRRIAARFGRVRCPGAIVAADKDG